MHLFMSVLMGAIQGVAEFLPISSSGHLALFQTFFGMENMKESHMLFTVLLHFGTMISVCLVYWRDIAELARELFMAVRSMARGEGIGDPPPPSRRMVMLLIVATMPLLVSIFFKDAVGALSSNSIVVSCALMGTGFLLFFSDRLRRGHKSARSATLVDAVAVGCAQAVAIIPGLSRSGATISVGMMRGFDRNFAVRFSFLLSLPAVLGANIIELSQALKTDFDTSLLPVYLTGVVVAAVVGYFSIRLVKHLADKGKFGKLAYYCWGVGLGSLVAGIVKIAVLK